MASSLHCLVNIKVEDTQRTNLLCLPYSILDEQILEADFDKPDTELPLGLDKQLMAVGLDLSSRGDHALQLLSLQV